MITQKPEKNFIMAMAILFLMIAIPVHADWNVWLDHSVKKYRQGGEDGSSGPSSLLIKAAKNEFESLQVLIFADGEDLHNVDVSVSDFTKGGDTVSDIYLYRQHYVNCSNPSRVEYGTGYYPDALLPKVDRYFGEIRNTFPFSVSQGHVQGVWVDVGTNTNTASGTYTATITISAQGKPNKILTVSLEVWDFALPSTATYPSLFPYQRSYMSYGHGRGLEWGGAWQTEMSKVYNKCALYHRIGTTFAGSDTVGYSWSDSTKTLTINSWGSWFDQYKDVLGGTAIVTGTYSGAKMRATEVPNAWMCDVNGPMSAADKQTATRQYHQQIFNKFMEEGWDPMTRLFVPVAKDEPNGRSHSWRGSTMTDYAICSDNGDDVNSVNTGGQGVWRNVYVNSKKKNELSDFETKGFYDPCVVNYVCDGWDRDACPCSNTWDVARDEYPGYPNNDMRHWAYLSCMTNNCSTTGQSYYSGQIDLSADAPSMYNRMIGFVFWKYEAKGTLYWGMNEDNYHGGGAPYNSIWYYGSNGDGHLLYPGVADKTGLSLPASTPAIGGTHDIPIESIRLKYIRDMMEDLEYMELAKSSAGKAAVDAQVDTMFSNTDIHYAYWNLVTDTDRLFIARENIAALVTETAINGSPIITSFTAMPSSMDSPGGQVTFDIQASDPDNDPLSYTISFGDGTPNVSSSQAVHTYSATGIFTAVAMVEDGHGHNVSTSLQITVGGSSPFEEIVPVLIGEMTVVRVDSEETTADNCQGINAIDGNPATIWHTEWLEASPGHPHEIVIDLGHGRQVCGFSYLPRQTGTYNGGIAQYEFFVSMDLSNWGSPVASGTWSATREKQEVSFDARSARYVKLVALSEVNGNPWTSAAEVEVMEHLGQGENEGPTINSFTSTPSSLNNPGETITLKVSATDPDGDSLIYTIDFGDGTANGSGSQVVHTYQTEGNYTAEVTVDDGNGNTVAKSLQITVDDVPPTKPTGVTVN